MPGSSSPAGTRSSLISASAQRTQSPARSGVTPAGAARSPCARSRWHTWCTSTLPSCAGVHCAVSAGSACIRQPSSTATVPISAVAITWVPNSPVARYGNRVAAHSLAGRQPGHPARLRVPVTRSSRAAAPRPAAPARTACTSAGSGVPSGRHLASVRAATAATSGAPDAALPSTCQPATQRCGVGSAATTAATAATAA